MALANTLYTSLLHLASLLPNISTLAILISPRKSPPKSPKWGPQNEFPGIPRIRVFCGNSPQTLNFPATPISALWGPHFHSRCVLTRGKAGESSGISAGSSNRPENSPSKTGRKGGENVHNRRVPIFSVLGGNEVDMSGPAFGRTDFFADFYFCAAGFFRGFSRRIFSPHFCGKKCPEKSPRKIPGKILQYLYNKNPPTHFCRLAGARHVGHCILPSCMNAFGAGSTGTDWRSSRA